MNNEDKYMSSKEVMKDYKISSCDLMHYRVSGRLTFQKNGRAFLYLVDDLDKLKSPSK